MSILISLLAENWQIIAGAGAFAAAFFMGGQRQRAKEIKKKAKADEKTHKRIDDIQDVDPVDRADITDRLRKLSK